MTVMREMVNAKQTQVHPGNPSQGWLRRLAAHCALRDGVAFNISGGFHHAFPDHGEGFNLINDVAVAIRSMQKDGKIKTAMTVDCDVHHGNGTAAIFGIQSAEPTPWPERLPYMRESPARDVFTISLHQENNYPAWKPQSSIDVGCRTALATMNTSPGWRRPSCRVCNGSSPI